MSLAAYSVAIGTFDHFTRDSSQQGTYGKYYHGHIYLKTPAGICECAVDVSTPEGMPVDYLRAALTPNAVKKVTKQPDGLHALASTAQSGALDYVRNKALHAAKASSWKRAAADTTLDLLEALLGKSSRVFVFGSPYKTGLGIHDVHMNQGDPAGSTWFAANGIWQDGGVIVEVKGTFKAFFTKFTNQSLSTDGQGNPI